MDIRLERGRIVVEPADTRPRWLNLRGVLRGTTALQDHLRDHRDELKRDGRSS